MELEGQQLFWTALDIIQQTRHEHITDLKGYKRRAQAANHRRGDSATNKRAWSDAEMVVDLHTMR